MEGKKVKVKWDIGTLRWLVSNYDRMKDREQRELKECEECGATYDPTILHDCDNTMWLEMYQTEE